METIIRTPDYVQVFNDGNWISYVKDGNSFCNEKARVSFADNAKGLDVNLYAKDIPLCTVKLRWHKSIPVGVKILGDALERSYGDLEWQGMNADRYHMWYCLVSDGATTGYGVKTQPNAFAFWQVDSNGITLWLDIKNGGLPVILDDRTITLATVLECTSDAEENEFAFGKRFCTAMCDQPIFPQKPVYGYNNWYCDYGVSSAEKILQYNDFLYEMTSRLENRPYLVIDAGWGGEACQEDSCAGGPWIKGNKDYPDVEKLARLIGAKGNIPGIWTRLSQNYDSSLPENMFIKRELPFQPQAAKGKINRSFDPTSTEAIAYIKEDVKRIKSWGYKLLKS